jgi:hypothetical protein
MTRIVLAMLLAATAIAAERAPGPVPDGMPFGPIGDADVDRLAEFAKKSGFDLKPEMERVYRKDEMRWRASSNSRLFSRDLTQTHGHTGRSFTAAC